MCLKKRAYNFTETNKNSNCMAFFFLSYSSISGLVHLAVHGTKVLYSFLSLDDGWVLDTVHFAQRQDESSAVTEKLRDSWHG